MFFQSKKSILFPDFLIYYFCEWSYYIMLITVEQLLALSNYKNQREVEVSATNEKKANSMIHCHQHSDILGDSVSSKILRSKNYSKKYFTYDNHINKKTTTTNLASVHFPILTLFSFSSLTRFAAGTKIISKKSFLCNCNLYITIYYRVSIIIYNRYCRMT